MARTEFAVVFVDILGFSHLVASNIGVIGGLDGTWHSSLSIDELQTSFEQEDLDQLTRTFTAFHRAIDLQINRLQRAVAIQLIAFSDSAFVAFPDLITAIDFSRALMRDLISLHVPIRVGIGTGSFRSIRFTTDVADDIRRHNSQFLGTAVIRAHQAESCGLKGLRIFLHPDVATSKDLHEWLCPVTATTPELKTAVQWEINYLAFPRQLPGYSPDELNANYGYANTIPCGLPG